MVVTSPVAPRDEELANRARARDRDAFATLYERHFQGVYDFAVRIVGNTDLANDVVQSAFVKVWEALPTGEPPRDFKAWIYAIARNTAIDELRRRKRFVSTEEWEGEEGAGLRFAAVDRSRLTDPELAAQDREIVALVWGAAAALSPRDYALLDMHLRQSLSTDEVAVALGVAKGNVYTMLSRLRTSLEESVTSTLLARRGRRACGELDTLLAGHEGAELTLDLRRSVQQHLRDCPRCQESKRRYVSPAAIFAAIAPLAVTATLQESLWQGMQGRLAGEGASGAASVQHAGSLRRLGRRWDSATTAVKVTAIGVVTSAAAVLVVAIVLVASGGGGIALEDPGDVRSTSHAIGSESSENIVTIVWSQHAAATAYAILWSGAPDDLPEPEADLSGDATGTVSPRLPPGEWYFHLRTRGENDAWTSTVHLGPFVIVEIVARTRAAEAEAEAAADQARAEPPGREAPDAEPAVTDSAGDESSDPGSAGAAADASTEEGEGGTAPAGEEAADTGAPGGTLTLVTDDPLPDNGQPGPAVVEADLAISTAAADPATAGETLSYTLMVTNRGPGTARVAVTDVLPAEVRFVSVTASQGSCSDAQGVIVCDLGQLAGGGLVRVSIEVEIDAAAEGMLTNSASVSSDVPDPNPGDNAASTTTAIRRLADVLVSDVVVTPDPATVGGTLSYRITLTNEGPSTASGVTLTNVPATDVTVVSVVAEQGSCDASDAQVSCELGSLAIGESTVVTVVVGLATAGTITNHATVAADEVDPEMSNNVVWSETTVIATAELALSMSDTSDPVLVGQNIIYTLTVINNGPLAAPNVILTDALPTGVGFRSATASSGECSEETRVVECRLGELAAGASATVTIVVRANVSGTLANTAIVTSDAFDPDTTDNVASEATVVILYVAPPPPSDPEPPRDDELERESTINFSRFRQISRPAGVAWPRRAAHLPGVSKRKAPEL